MVKLRGKIKSLLILLVSTVMLIKKLGMNLYVLQLFIYNCSRHAITKQIPFCLEKGVNPRLEIDQILKSAINQNDDINTNLWTKELYPKITKILGEASRNLK